MRKILFVLLVTSSLYACKKESENAASAGPTQAQPTEAKPVEAPPPAEPTPEEPTPADTQAQEAGSAGAAAAATPATATTEPGPVDVCAILTKEQVEDAVGAKVTGEPQPDAPSGSLLGGCKWKTSKGSVSVAAHPLADYDATAADGAEVAGVGAAAKMTNAGIVMKLEGKPYFLHVVATTGTTIDKTKTKKVAMGCGGPPPRKAAPPMPTE